MTADKGLAGAFNSNVIRAAEQFAREQGAVRYYTVGLKARNAVRRLGNRDHPTWPLGAIEDRYGARGRPTRRRTISTHGAISEIVLVSSKAGHDDVAAPRDAQARSDSVASTPSGLRAPLQG